MRFEKLVAIELYDSDFEDMLSFMTDDNYNAETAFWEWCHSDAVERFSKEIIAELEKRYSKWKKICKYCGQCFFNSYECQTHIDKRHILPNVHFFGDEGERMFWDAEDNRIDPIDILGWETKNEEEASAVFRYLTLDHDLSRDTLPDKPGVVVWNGNLDKYIALERN